MATGESLSSKDMQTILLFLMSKLTPGDLEELDAQLVGEASPMASDSRFGSDENRGKLLRLGPVARRAARQVSQSHYAQDAASTRSIDEMFPNLKRLIG